jgi:hypothetical protein
MSSLRQEGRSICLLICLGALHNVPFVVAFQIQIHVVVTADYCVFRFAPRVTRLPQKKMRSSYRPEYFMDTDAVYKGAMRSVNLLDESGHDERNFVLECATSTGELCMLVTSDEIEYEMPGFWSHWSSRRV